MSGNNKEGGLPNTYTFLFFGILLVGALYAVLVHGFMGVDTQAATTENVFKGRISFVKYSAEAEAEGAEVAKKCAACHNTGFKGQTTGPDLSDAEWLHGVKSERGLVKLITTGIPAGQAKFPSAAGGMPPKGGLAISDADVWKVVYYLSHKINRGIVRDASEK